MTRPSPRAALAPALACTALALALRLAYLAAVAPPQDTPGLARKYQACAANLLEGHGWFLGVGQAPVPYVDRLPGYVTLLAGLFALGVTTPLALSIAHALFGSLQAAAACLAGRTVAGARAGWIAGLLVAAWPPLWKSDLQLVETGLSGLAVTALAAVALGAGPKGRAARAAALSLLSLGCVLLRPDYLLVPLMVAALQLLQDRRRGLAPALLTLALPVLACTAWAVRNGRVADARFVTVGLGTNLLAAVGESLPSEAPLFGDQDVARSEGHSGLYWPDPARRDRARTRRALELIRRHPAPFLRGCVRRIAVTASMHPGRLWPGPAAEEEIRAWRAANPGRGRYEGLFHAVAAHVRAHPFAALGTFAWAPLLWAGALAGAWRLRRRPMAVAVLVALPAYAIAVHVPLHAEPRYFFPFVPLLLVLAAVACVARRSASPADEA